MVRALQARARHLPRDQDGVVVMSHPIFGNAVAIAVMRQDGLLPLTETVQRLVSMVVDLQVGLQSENTSVRNKLNNTDGWRDGWMEKT